MSTANCWRWSVAAEVDSMSFDNDSSCSTQAATMFVTFRAVASSSLAAIDGDEGPDSGVGIMVDARLPPELSDFARCVHSERIDDVLQARGGSFVSICLELCLTGQHCGGL